MAILPARIAAAAAKELPAIFKDAVSGLGQGEGQFIKDGTPDSFAGRISQAAARSSCRVYASDPGRLNEATAERYETACRPYLGSIGQMTAPQLTTQFQGGQCPGVLYGFQIRQTRGNGSTSLGVDRRARGPFEIRARASSFAPDGQVTGYAIEVLTTQFYPAGSSAPPIGPRIWRTETGSVTVSTGDSIALTLENLRTFPTGTPDNCGNPPPVVVPPRALPDPTPPPFRFNPIPGLDIDLDVGIDADGNITFDIGTGPITVNPFPDDDAGGGGDGGGGDPTDPGVPGSPSDTGSGGDDEGEAPEGSELVGLMVEVLAAPPIAPTTGRTTQTVYRGIGYVRMGFEGRLGVDVSGGVAFPTQFYHAQQRGLTHWATNANIGFNLRTTPYYRDIQ